MRDCSQRSANIQKSHHVHEIQLEMQAAHLDFLVLGLQDTYYLVLCISDMYIFKLVNREDNKKLS